MRTLNIMLILLGITTLVGGCGNGSTSSNADSETLILDENGNPRVIIQDQFNSD